MDALTLLRRQYYALCPAYLLSVPAPATLASEEGHAALLRLLGEDPPAPEREYARQFWRRVLPALEKGVMLGEGVEEVSRSAWRQPSLPPSFLPSLLPSFLPAAGALGPRAGNSKQEGGEERTAALQDFIKLTKSYR